MLKSFNFESVTHYNPNTGWFVAVTAEGEKVVGNSIVPPYGMVTVEAEQETSKYGPQWRCKKPVHYESLEALTLSLLESGIIKGINEGKAQAVYDAFGDQLWTILSAAAEGVMTIEFKGRTRNPMDLLQDAKGVGKVVAKQMVESWREERATFTSAMLAIRCELTLYQFRNLIRDEGGYERFYKMVHNEAPHSIYDLVTWGVTWEQVDKVALEDWPDKPALDWGDPIRIAGAVKHVLSRYILDGQMCMPLDIVEGEARDLIGIDHAFELIPDVEQVGLKIFNGMVYTRANYDLEVEIAQRINSIRRTAGRIFPLDADEIQSYADYPLHQHQIEAIQMVLNHKVSIYTGGPGVGKTTILKVLVDILTDRGVQVTLCAFMGSAARRMKIATGHEASTLHKQFDLFLRKEERSVLLSGFLFIDEMSTVPADLLRDTLAQVGDDVHVVFIGDKDQLPPVGRGEPFVQLLESNIPRVYLTQLFRNGGAIAQACRDVNEGRMPQGDNKDFFLITKCDEENIPQRLLDAETFFTKNEWHKPQLITPLNGDGKKIKTGRKQLNELFQNIRNPKGEHIPFTPVRVGDRVVQRRNNYEIEVRNGMTGNVMSRTDDAKVIVLSMAAQKVDPALAMPSWVDQDKIHIMDVMFDEEMHPHEYLAKHLDEIELGYAITVHKSQGNQFPYVFVVLPKSLPPMLRLRQIVYTAMSRAKSKLFVVASPGVMEECVANEYVERRYSNLANFISEFEMEAAYE